MEARLLLDAHALLGEGSIWNYREQTLWWVDIDNGELHVYNPGTGTDSTYEMGKKIGTVVPATDGTAVVALQDGIYTYDFMSKELTFKVRPDNYTGNIRFNDGKCDPAGRLWAGTMGMGRDIKGKAFLYRFDRDFSAHTLLDSITISNGICWSSDKTKMYYIDTPTQKVREYAYDQGSGKISFTRTVVEVPPSEGHPDGMTIDAEGKLWVALWGGSAVACYDPETGRQVSKIRVAAPNVSSCAFGGRKLKTLYITTASTGMNATAREQYPNAGGVFFIELDVRGTRASFFKR